MKFIKLVSSAMNCFTYVPMDSPSRGGDVAIYVFDKNQLSLSTPSYSVLMSLSVPYYAMSISVFMAFSPVFHSKKVLPTTLCFPTLFFWSCFCLIGPFKYITPYWSFQPLYIFMKVSFSPNIILCDWLGLKYKLTSNLCMKLVNTDAEELTYQRWSEKILLR